MRTEGAGLPAPPASLTVTDPRLMRALAHPARMAIVELLNGVATVTATECAEVTGLSPSAASYHLRALAKHGLVEKAPSRGDGRERVWRGAVSGVIIEPGRTAEPDTMAAAREVLEVSLARDNDRVRRWQERASRETPEWYAAAMVSDSIVRVTAEELAELNQAMLRLIAPYKQRNRADPPAGARTVTIQYRAVPVD